LGILEILTKRHPHVQNILRVPIMPLLWTEDELTVLLLIVRLVNGIVVKESVIAVLVVETHFYLLSIRF
jgi:hypothetical protein